ncbi:serine/threonine protein kinase [Fusarium austroafricanum]|uniref:non-specific serine/threonine protein kinase n=1 Tax=Fusarium austroafricanum TaxID=2364996 RepID=A0A8H4KF44_9HYPO|nr:serine/threonine protein kinase [Fusarium austroafricanum]
MAALRVELSLTSWEKELIRETRNTFSKELSLISPHASSLVSKDWIRNNWSWATHVLVQLRESCPDLENEELAIHQSNPVRTWEILRNKLSSRTPPSTSLDSYSCQSRLKQFLDANNCLPSLISQQQFPEIPQDCIQFASDDDEDWQTVWNFSRFIKTNHPRLHGVQLSNDDLEELEQLFQNLCSQQDGEEGDNTGEAQGHWAAEPNDLSSLREYPDFEIHSIVRTVASYSRQSQRELPNEVVQMPREWGSILIDLEYIPLSELTTDGDLSEDPIASWKPNKACPLDHHLYTEEEVLKYCIEAKFEFPGYRGENGIIFEATSLDESELCKARQDLEVIWPCQKNDCAFTFDPATNQTYLLQTRPGITFRKLQKQFSLGSARKYFRSITDQHRLNRLESFDSVLDNMQLQNSKVKAYGGLVDLIPFDEITLSGETNDTGHSGAIPFGSWNVPQGARLHRPDSEVIPVALKLVWRPGDPKGELSKRELASSIVTFSDSPIASIRLNGLTVNPDSNDIFLVFERARSLPEFLEENLVHTGNDWDVITGLLKDAADSLEVIHQRGHLHRDIHMGNVLIHSVPCPNDPYDSEYTELVIIDLGQGQDMSDSVYNTSNSYGDPSYRAPEVKSTRQYSEKSDVFAIGYLMTEILEIRCKKANDNAVPKALWDLISICLLKDAADRPKAEEFALQAEKLREDFFVLPEERENVTVRGEVVMNGPYVDFQCVLAEWKKSLDENEMNEGDDMIPYF